MERIAPSKHTPPKPAQSVAKAPSSQAFGAPCMKKLEPISKRSMEASLHENFAKP